MFALHRLRLRPRLRNIVTLHNAHHASGGALQSISRCMMLVAGRIKASVLSSSSLRPTFHSSKRVIVEHAGSVFDRA